MIRNTTSTALILGVVAFTLVSAGCQAALPQPKMIVAIGDSLVSGGELRMHQGHESTITGGWVTRLQSMLDDSYPGEYETINMGVSGATALGVQSQLPNAIDLGPSMVLMQVGGNDFRGSYSAESFESKLERFQLQVEQIVEDILEDSPMTAVYIIGYPTNLKQYAEESYPFLNYDEQEVLDDRFRKFNDILAMIAEKHGVNFVDILSHWPDDVEDQWQLSADGIHPDDDGYDLITTVVYNAIFAQVSE